MIVDDSLCAVEMSQIMTPPKDEYFSCASETYSASLSAET